MNRRDVLCSAVAFAAVLGVPLRALALSPNQAQTFVTAVVDEINAVLNAGWSEPQFFVEFERLFAIYADVPTIARFTLGVDARSASAADLNAYTRAFQGYMARKYGKQFRDLIGGSLQVAGARAVKSFVEVTSTAQLHGSDPVEVKFHVSDRGGPPRVFNIYVEGINMLLTERTEIQTLLDQRGGSIARLARDIAQTG